MSIMITATFMSINEDDVLAKTSETVPSHSPVSLRKYDAKMRL